MLKKLFLFKSPETYHRKMARTNQIGHILNHQHLLQPLHPKKNETASSTTGWSYKQATPKPSLKPLIENSYFKTRRKQQVGCHCCSLPAVTMSKKAWLGGLEKSQLACTHP